MTSIYQLSIFFIALFLATRLTHCQEKFDLCKTKPCANKGICYQTKEPPNYKCQCFGTGFHGQRCNKACPSVKNSSKLTERVPYECIVI